MDNPTLLWVDFCSIDGNCSELVSELSGSFPIVTLEDDRVVSSTVARLRPTLAVFDYEYPCRSSLSVLRETKEHYPDIPIIMLTFEHSEALAIWALRARAWDYLVKPVRAVDIAERVAALTRSKLPVNGMRARGNLMPPPPIPEELRIGEHRGPLKKTSPALEFVAKNFASNIQVKNAAEECQMDYYQFSRCFKQEHGLGFREYLIRYRINKALSLLNNPNATIADAAYATGFQGASYFTRVFRDLMGVTPAKYRSTLSAIASEQD